VNCRLFGSVEFLRENDNQRRGAKWMKLNPWFPYGQVHDCEVHVATQSVPTSIPAWGRRNMHCDISERWLCVPY